MVVLAGLRRPAAPLVVGAHALVGETGTMVGQIEDLPEVDGERLGRVVTLGHYPAPDRYWPPLCLPLATVRVDGARVAVVYPRGFRGGAGETGVALDLLTPEVWARFGLQPELTDQDAIDRFAGVP